MKAVLGGRIGGKTLMINKMITEYIKRNPDATIIRYQNGEAVIEKPVKQVSMKKIEAAK